MRARRTPPRLPAAFGADPDFVPAATVTESDATLGGLPGCGTVKVRVTAANAAGENPPSAEAEIAVS
jgi:hypothetical protein